MSGSYAGVDEAGRLLEFFSYFEGKWEVAALDVSGTGSVTIKRGESGTCHVLEYRAGGERKTELWGYDPTGRCWAAVGFNQNGERYSQVMLGVPEHATAKVGDRWSAKHEGVLPSGENTSARLDFCIESEDSYTVVVTNITVGEAKPENASFRIARQR